MRKPWARSTTSSKQQTLTTGSMEDLQDLMEQLQQLKATNEQLREQLREQSQVLDPVPWPSTILPNVALVIGLASEAMNPLYIYIPREHNCPKFTEKMSVDLLTAEQWVEEVHRCLEVRHMPVAEQLLFVTNHLDGGAKSEVNFHPSTN